MKNRIVCGFVLVVLLLNGLGSHQSLGGQISSEANNPWSSIRQLSTYPDVSGSRMVVEADNTIHFAWTVNPHWTWTAYSWLTPAGYLAGPYSLTSSFRYADVSDLVKDGSGNLGLVIRSDHYNALLKLAGQWWGQAEEISYQYTNLESTTATFDASGKLHFIYCSNLGNWRYANNLRGWSDLGETGFSGYWCSSPRLALDRLGKVVLIFLGGDSGGVDYSCKSPEENTWPQLQPVFDSSTHTGIWDGLAVTKDFSGNICVFASVRYGHGDRRYYRSFWDGHAWSSPELVYEQHSGDPGSASIWPAIDSSGNMILLWSEGNQAYEMVKLQERSWSRPQPAFSGGGEWGMVIKSVGVDSQGRTHLLFEDGGYGSGSGPYYVIREPLGVNEPATLSLSPIQVEEGPYPFLPNQVTLKTTVTNQGPVEARNVRVQFFKGHPNSGGIQMGESNHGNIPQGESREASLLWELGGNLEGATVYIRAVCDNQQMGNAEASMVSAPLSVYYVDFRLNRDAYSFCNNWTYERREFVEDLKIIMEASDEGGPLASFATLVWIYMRQQLEKGYCYGMSLSSARYWQNPSLKPVPNLSTYELNKEVAKAGIEAYQRRVFWGNALYMVMSGVKPETEWKFRWDLEYNLLISSLKNGRPSVMRVPGHATLAYKLVNTGSESRVYVYDPSRTIMPTQGCVALDSPPAYGTFYFSNKTFRYELDNANACWIEEVSPYFAPLWSVARNLFRLIVADLTGRARTVLAFGSPVEPLAIDQYGRRLGLVGGSVVSEIPEAEFYQFEEDKLFLLPAQLRYTVTTVGTGAGVMDLGIILPRDLDQADCAGYEGVPVTQGSVTRMSISQDMTDWGLQTDWGIRQPDTVDTVRIQRMQLPLLYRNRDTTSQPTPTLTVTAVPTATNTPSPSPAPTATRPPTSTPVPNDGKIWGECRREGTWELVPGACVKVGSPDGYATYGENCTDVAGVYKFDFLQRPDPVTRYGVWLARNPGDIRVANLTEGQKVIRIDFTVP